jgi:hypothetical protein
MAVDLASFEAALAGLEAGLGDEVEAWLADPARTAHRLVSVPTAQLVAQAIGTPAVEAAAGPVLPGGLWRILPDRLLTLRPHRRVQVTVAQHLALTAHVLDRWGWGQTGRRRHTPTGRRCIRGAQYVVWCSGYGDEQDAIEAARQIQGALARRGYDMPYTQWNDLPSTTSEQAIGLVREAAAGVA